MVALAGLAILHGCIAAAFIEGVMRAWDVRMPRLRLALRVLALVTPFLSPLVSVLVAPVRDSSDFQVAWALYAGANWDNLRVGQVPLSVVGTAALGLAGFLLFARDTVPFLVDRLRGASLERTLDASHPASVRMSAAVARTPAAISGPPTPTTVLHTDAAVLYCSGIGRPALTVSTGTLARLDDEELRAAVAHELEHARRRDPALGWLLMLVRTLQAFNPATQVVGRQIVEEIERRADGAVAASGLGAPLAGAMAKLSAVARPTRSDLSADTHRAPFLSTFAQRAATRAMLMRCERVRQPWPAEPRAHVVAHTVLAAAGLWSLLLFVV